MDYYLDNKKSLMTRGLGLDDIFINETETNEEEDIQVYLQQTKNGESCLEIKKIGVSYRMNSSYNPSQETSFWIKQFKFDKENSVISLFGLGNGHFAKTIMSNMGDKDFLMIIEPSKKVFLYVMENYDMSDIINNPRVILIVMGVNNETWVNFSQLAISWENIRNQIYCYHPRYTSVFPEEAKLFIETTQKNNETVSIIKNTTAHFGKKYVFSMIESLHCLPKMNSLKACKNIFSEDIPGIIIAAGPSLDDNVQELKKVKDRVILFATDRALPTLFKNNIIPNFIVTVDPDKADNCFKNPMSKVIPMICPAHAKEEVLVRHKGNIFLSTCYSYISNLIKELGSEIPNLNTGNSVATTAFSICVYLGLKNIIFVGQDLAYKGDCSHTGGELENVALHEEKYVEGVHGELVKTRYDWENFRLWYEREIKALDSQYNIIDATEGGALIHGTLVMTLQNAIHKYCKTKFNFDEIMNGIPKLCTEEKLLIVNKYILQSVEECDLLVKKADEVSSICKQSLKRLQEKRFDKELVQNNYNCIIETNKYIENLQIYSLVDLGIFKTATKKHGEVNANLSDNIDLYEQLFRMYGDVYSEILKIAEEMKGRFEKQLILLQQH